MGTDWEEVFDRRYRHLVALVGTVLGSPAEAEAAVQAAFVRALGTTGRRAAMKDPEGWLYRVAISTARSRRRRAAWRGRRATGPTPGPGDVDGRDDGHGVPGLLAALSGLPFEQREVLALHYQADLPVAVIATRLGVTPATVKGRLSQGCDALARLLDTHTGAGTPDAPRDRPAGARVTAGGTRRRTTGRTALGHPPVSGHGRGHDCAGAPHQGPDQALWGHPGPGTR